MTNMLPLTKKRVKHLVKPPWISKEIENEMKFRDYLLRSKQRDKYRQQRNKVNCMKRKTKMKYFQDLLSQAQNSKLIWKAINTLTDRNSKSSFKRVIK